MERTSATRGFLFTPTMKTKLMELSETGHNRTEASSILAKMAANEIQKSDVAKKEYMDLWTKSGVTIASSCLMGPAPFDDAFEIAVDNISHARAYANALPEHFEIVLTSDDIKRVANTYFIDKNLMVMHISPENLGFGKKLMMRLASLFM